jgi:hypothetical protein
MAQCPADVDDWFGTQEAASKVWHRQFRGDRLNRLGRLEKVRLGFLLSPQSRQDLPERGLSQPDLPRRGRKRLDGPEVYTICGANSILFRLDDRGA